MKGKIFLFFGGLLVVNLFFLDFVFFKQKPIFLSISQSPKVAAQPIKEIIKECPSVCLKEMQQIVKEEVASLPSPAKTQVVTMQNLNYTPSLKISYIAINGSGSTTSVSWADVPGTDFYFNLTDYPGVKSIRWELNLQSYLSTDPAYIRLYDVTNKRGVDGSDQMTKSSSYDYIRSSDLSIWRGNNLYRIQIKGSSGNTVNFTSARLMVILE